MNDTDGADLALAVGAKPVLDGLRVNAAAPVRLQKLGLDPQPVGHFLPQGRKVAGLDHQHALTLIDQIDKRRFPGTGAGRRIDTDRRFRLEDCLHAVKTRLANLGKGRAAMINRRMIHRPQHPVGYIGRPGDLQKMTTCLITAGLITGGTHVR